VTFKIHPQLQTDSRLIGHFKLCQLRLIDDQQYPWFILIPQVAQIEAIHQLDNAQRQALWQESHKLSMALMEQYKPDKLNVAAIGNRVSQLHLHHVVRFKQDACWPNPVWGQLPMQSYSQSEQNSCIQQMTQVLVGQGLIADADSKNLLT